jgi:hypothetical protein
MYKLFKNIFPIIFIKMSNPESIKSWNITNTRKHYLLDKNSNNTFITKLLDQQEKEKETEKEKEKEETFIEFWQPDTSISSFQISYIKKEGILYENPKSTFILFLSDDAPSIISLDLDFDQYKYKTFTSENKAIIIPPKKGKVVSINPNHFYGFHNLNINQNIILTQDSNILMINIWTTKPPHLEYYTDKIMDENTTKLDTSQEVVYIENSIFNETFYEQLLYKKNNQIITDLYEQIKENYPFINTDTSNLIIYSQKKPFKNPKYFQETREKYGNIINDIYEIEVNNIVPKNLLQKMNIPFFFSLPITNWYNLEINKNQKLWQPVKNSTSNFSLEALPYLTTLIYTHTDQIINKIKETYQLGGLNISINKYFIEKMQLDKENKIDKINNFFLSVYIVLQGSMNICFAKEPNHMYIVNIGDLIVFGGENYSIKSNGTEDIIVLGYNIEYTI